MESLEMDKKKQLTACFTGHRFIKKESLPEIEKTLESVIEALIQKGVIYYGCGGAIGFDMIAGYTVIRMKKQYPQIKLIMVLPCENQDLKWRPADKEKYRELLALADKTVCLQSEYDDGCMLKRNRHMVDNSCTCIAFLTKSRGGSFYTVNYAAKQNKNIINIAELLRKLSKGMKNNDDNKKD